ncbi:MAG: hypothetical protein IIA00_01390 [Proteobacteria bacterium]|nr:hypothetical protein [Pseudomonadota bacterium]
MVVFGWFPAAVSAGHPERYVTVDGVRVHLGIIPAEKLRLDADHFGEHNLQCPPPRARNSYHVLVALFDASSGERITDAEVKTRISPLGLVGPRKHLHPVSVADAVTYCNYFDLSPMETYFIEVEIQRRDATDVIRATFEYKTYRE